MSFVKKYGILAISVLTVYGLFILGSVTGFIGITGNVIDTLRENTIWFVYGGVAIAGIAVLVGIIFVVIRFLKKRKLKKESISKQDEINKKMNFHEVKKQKDRKENLNEVSKTKKKAKEIFVKQGNDKINALLLEGGRALTNEELQEARKIYKKIKKIYDPKGDIDKKLYQRIVNYYNILKEK